MSTTNTAAPITQLATSSLIWVGRRKNHAQHEAAVTEIRRRFEKTNRPNSLAKLGAFLVAYDLGNATATEAPEAV